MEQPNRKIIASASDIGLQVLRGLSDLLGDLGDDYSVPIIKELKDGGSPVPLGTGCFFRCCDEWFLVTAAHVIADLFPRGFQKPSPVNECNILVPGTNNRLVSLSGEATAHAHAEYDVAIMRLHDPGAVSERWRPVTLAQVDRKEDPKGAWYHFAGWPIERTSRDSATISGEKYRFTQAHDASSVDHDPAIHIVLPNDRSEHVTFDGELVRTPELEGVSGSPVWRIFEESEGVYEPRFAGVQTGYVPKGSVWHIKATRWWVVRALIDRAVPGLLDAPERLVVPRHMITKVPRGVPD